MNTIRRKNNCQLIPGGVLLTNKFYQISAGLYGLVYKILIVNADTIDCPQSVLVKLATILGNESDLPNIYTLNQNFHNPFHTGARIIFTIPLSGNYEIKVYDILGNYITTIFDGFTSVGRYSTEFNGIKLKSGVYFYHLIGENITLSKKMILIK